MLALLNQCGVGWASVSLGHLGLQEVNLTSALPSDCQKRPQSPRLFPWGPLCKFICFCLRFQKKMSWYRWKKPDRWSKEFYFSTWSNKCHLSSPPTYFLFPSSFCPQTYLAPLRAKIPPCFSPSYDNFSLLAFNFATFISHEKSQLGLYIYFFDVMLNKLAIKYIYK